MSDEATATMPDAVAATLLAARQYIQDTVPCQRIVHGSCSTRACYIANGWSGKDVVDVEPRCKEFQIIADIDALIYPMQGRVNTFSEREALLREAVMALAPNVRLTARIGLAQRISAALLPAPDGAQAKEQQ